MERWWKSAQPGTMRRVPWLHPAVVAYMDLLIEPGFRVLEHGSGGSTIWFAERAAHVDTVEHNPEWAKAVEAETGDNVTVHLNAPPRNFYGKDYDLLLIDGNSDDRNDWVQNATRMVKPGGIVVLDNANRPQYRPYMEGLRSESEHWIRFDTNPPRHSHAVTDMFRMKGDPGKDWI